MEYFTSAIATTVRYTVVYPLKFVFNVFVYVPYRAVDATVRFPFWLTRSAYRLLYPYAGDTSNLLAKDAKIAGKRSNTYSKMEGYLLVVSEFDMSDAPSFKPRDIPKILNPKRKAEAGKKMILQQNMFYASFNGPKRVLTLHCARESDKTILTSEYEISICPRDLPSNKHYTRALPIELVHTKTSEKLYLFAPTGIQKEQWFLSLTKPSRALVKDLFHPEKDYLNAVIARIWASAYSTTLQQSLQVRLERTLARMKKPQYLLGISLKKLTVGEKPPTFKGTRLTELSSDGAMEITTNVEFKGNVEFVIEAEIKKAMKINVTLLVKLEEISGKLMIKANPLPSSRIWYGFATKPRVSFDIKPLVGDTDIGFNLVKDAIDKKLHELIEDTIVLPNMEDLTFFADGDSQLVWSQIMKQAEALLSPRSTSPTSSATTSPQNPPKDTQHLDTTDMIALAAKTVPSLNLSPTIARKSGMAVKRFSHQTSETMMRMLNNPRPASADSASRPNKWFQKAPFP